MKKKGKKERIKKGKIKERDEYGPNAPIRECALCGVAAFGRGDVHRLARTQSLPPGRCRR